MKIGVLGTGIVGSVIADKLVSLGHDVMMGGREAHNEKGQAWASKHPQNAHYGTFAQAATFGELLFACVLGTKTLEALEMAGDANLNGKTLIDLGNELDFSTGKPHIFASWDNCLAERIQNRFPKTNVVKSLNTMNCYVMVNPSLVQGEHAVFMSGNNLEAKTQTRNLLKSFGWTDHMIVDLGGIETARGVEMLMGLWVSLWGVIGNEPFNVGIFRKA
jgi:8-hydroxy-5-deazaflavin:NADPH oxidoreductase